MSKLPPWNWVFVLLLSVACRQAAVPDPPAVDRTEPQLEFSAPAWVRNAVIYEVNVRQFTKEGTFNAILPHLERIEKMGISIIGFRHIHAVSKQKTKEESASLYAVADYRKVNPEFGTMEDFKNLVNRIHDLGMYVIIDWVPARTGWDNPWVTQHPEWYTEKEHDHQIDALDQESGETGVRTEVSDLNYNNEDMQKAMIDAMSFWLRETNIDGFRVDGAPDIPSSFFTNMSQSLQRIKPVLLLAEGEVPEHRNLGSFHMSYAWRFRGLIQDIMNGEKTANDLDAYLKEDAELFNQGFHLYFTSNYHENTREGTAFERLGEGHLTFAVLASTIDGMPLLYAGQEEGGRMRIESLQRDPVRFDKYEYEDFYRTLFALKKRNKALWNGNYGGKLQRIHTNKDEAVYAFLREKEGDKLVVILNLSDQAQHITLEGKKFIGEYNNIFANSTVVLTKGITMTLKPWDYLVLSNR